MTEALRDEACDQAAELLVQLRFAARADRMKLLRGSLLAAARMCGFDEWPAQDILLAVSEACQNVMLHAYRGRGEGEIALCIYRLDDGILVRLRDFAPPVDPAKIAPRPLDAVAPGGLGTHFIREIMDEIRFLPPPGGEGNLLEMVKRTGRRR